MYGLGGLGNGEFVCVLHDLTGQDDGTRVLRRNDSEQQAAERLRKSTSSEGIQQRIAQLRTRQRHRLQRSDSSSPEPETEGLLRVIAEQGHGWLITDLIDIASWNRRVSSNSGQRASELGRAAAVSAPEADKEQGHDLHST
jgi:hypothetical protein